MEGSRPTENVSVIISVMCCGEHDDDDVNMNLNKLIQLNDLYLGASEYQETGRERERSMVQWFQTCKQALVQTHTHTHTL